MPVPLLGLHDDGKHLLAALDWLEANCHTRPVGEQVILQYHRLVYAKNEKGAGEYRSHEIVMNESVIKRRSANKVVVAMKAFDSRRALEQNRLDVLAQPHHDIL